MTALAMPAFSVRFGGSLAIAPVSLDAAFRRWLATRPAAHPPEHVCSLIDWLVDQELRRWLHAT